MTGIHERRTVLKLLGVGAAAGALGSPASASRSEAAAASQGKLVLPGATELAALTAALAAMPRQRDFKTVPMNLHSPLLWDRRPLAALLAYKAHKMVVSNTDLDGPWLRIMHNSLNAQILSFDCPNFLITSLTHGSAHHALYDDTAWEKYQLTALAGPKFKRNPFLAEPDLAIELANLDDAGNAFAHQPTSIPILQQRGCVFLACHNAIWGAAEKLLKAGINPDKLSVGGIAADLTNRLIPGVVLTPGAIGTLPELQLAGFCTAFTIV